MNNELNYSVGICRSCTKNCATCFSRPNKCTSCIPGFLLNNFMCIAINKISFNIILASGNNHTTTFSNVVNQINDIFLGICDILGANYRVNNYLVFINSISNGSIILSGNAGIDNNTNDLSTVYNDVSSNILNAKTLNSYTITSSSINAEGFTPVTP